MMLRQIMATRFADRALRSLQVVPIRPVGGPPNNSLSIVSCRHFHEICSLRTPS
jgi:hypothetical protein